MWAWISDLQLTSDIGSSAFSGCRNLIDVRVPEGIEQIKDSTFSRCSRLRYVELPDTIKHIGSGAFYECERLGNVTLPHALESIGPGAFERCRELIIENKDISSVDMQWMAFNGCENMQDENGLVIINGILYGYYGKHKKVIIPDGVVIIDSWVFGGKNITEVYIPDSVIKIGSGAFCGCSNLETIYIPMNVSYIDNLETFDSCDKLTIKTPAGSYAEQFAKRNNIPVENVEN